MNTLPKQPFHSAGDVVQLKSGGPEMTVHGPLNSSPDLYFCQWFGGGRKLESATFHASVLRTVPPGS